MRQKKYINVFKITHMRTKDIFYIVCAVVFFMGIQPVYAWPFMSLEDKAAQITDEVVEGITTTSTTVVDSIGQGIMKVFCASLKPDFSAFNGLINGVSLESIIHNLAKDLGIILAFLILIVAAYSFFFAKAEEPRDTPVGLIIHFFIAMVVILASLEITTAITEDANIIWQSDVMKYREDKTLGDDGYATFTDAVVEHDGTIEVLGITLGSLAAVVSGYWIIALVALIVFLVLFIPYLKALIRLYMEILTRYLLWCFILLFMPLAAATMVSNTTSTIWKSYLRMVISTFLIFIIQVFLFAVSVDITLSGFITKGVVGYFLGLSFINVSTRFDMYVARLGVSVAQSAAACRNALMGGVRGLIMGASMGDRLRHSAGSTILAAGAASGNFGAVKLGQALLFQGGGSSGPVNGFGTDMNAFAEIGKHSPGSLNLEPDDAKKFMKDFIASPKHDKTINALNALSEDSKLFGLNGILEEGAMNNSLLDGVKATDVSVDPKTGDISFFGVNADNQEISGTISNDELAKGIALSDDANIEFDNQVKGSVDDYGNNNSWYKDDQCGDDTVVDRDGCERPLNPNADKVLMRSGNAALAADMQAYPELQGVTIAEMNGTNTLLKDKEGHQIGLVTADGSYFKANRGSGAAHDVNQAYGMDRKTVEEQIGLKISDNRDEVYTKTTADGMPFRKINSSTFEVPAKTNTGQIIPVRISSVGDSNGTSTIGKTINGKTQMKGRRFDYNGHTYVSRKNSSGEQKKRDTPEKGKNNSSSK